VDFLVPLALIGWIPLCVGLFAVLPARRAVIVAIIAAWLFLPPATLLLPGFPDYSKSTAATLGIVLGTLIFEPGRLLAFRFRWFDLPMLLWCLCGFASSAANGLGMYDGLSALFSKIIVWGLPYLIGRLYFNTPEALKELAIGIIIGGIVYVPLCLFEIRMSPQLLRRIYGIGKWHGMRLGGYRPNVFFKTGLELGLWMTAVSMTAVWLWRSGTIRKIGLFSFGAVVVPVLLITTVLCRSTGALFLLLVGLTILFLSTRFNTKWLLFALLLTAPLYYAVRIPNYWNGEPFGDLTRTYLDPARAQSFEFRLQMENILAHKAMQQPILGWGGWGRNRVTDKTGRDIAPTDGMWIIHLGVHGLVGLSLWTTAMLLPSFLFALRYPVRQWHDPTIGSMAVLAVLICLYQIDCLMNGFVNLIYITAAGGLMCALPPPRYGEDELSRSVSGDLQRRRDVGAFTLEGDLPGNGQGLDETDWSQEELFDPALAAPQYRLAERYERLARSLRAQGQLRDARAAWTHAFDLLTGLASSHLHITAYRTRQADCANNLAWFLVSEPGSEVSDPHLAVQLATRATQTEPSNATYWNTLGAARCRAGDPSGAIAALEHSLALTDGGTAFDHLFLALAHAQLGLHDQAGFWCAQADRWIQQRGANHPELLRLRDEVHARLASHPATSGTAS